MGGGIHVFDAKFDYQDDSWRPPRRLVEDEDRQQEIFHALAGEYMGAGPTKGDTYKWVTNHLADAAGFAAPRSFLLAMKEGADKTNWTNPLRGSRYFGHGFDFAG